MKIKLVLIVGVLSFVTIIGCNGTNNSKEKELALKEKELLLKEKELSLKEAEQNTPKPEPRVNDTLAKPKPSINQLSNLENLIGNWFVPHAAVINIKFNRNGRFEFNDYNTILEKDEFLTGEYKLSDGVLTLMYDDRPKQNFKFYKGEGKDNNYYIKKEGYYFVKGENGN